MLNLWGLIAGTASNHVEVEPHESLGHFCSSFDLPRVCKVPCSFESTIDIIHLKIILSWLLDTLVTCELGPGNLDNNEDIFDKTRAIWQILPHS